MPRRKWLHKLGCETSPKPRCLLYWCCWLKKPVPNCTSALQHRWSGALDSRECCWGKPLVKGRSRVSLAQFCSVCMVLTSFGSPDLPISSHFASCHRAELERSLGSLPPAESGLCEVWRPIGSYKVTPEETRYWLNFFAFFAFSKWELTGLSLLPSRAATRLGFSVGWPSSCCGVCWSCIFQLTFYGCAQGGDKLMWTKCVVSTVVPAAPVRESR